ncbi:hypothetical protein D3C87_1830240 [compost metagenome]
MKRIPDVVLFAFESRVPLAIEFMCAGEQAFHEGDVGVAVLACSTPCRDAIGQHFLDQRLFADSEIDTDVVDHTRANVIEVRR